MNIKELETAWQESCSKSITFIVTKDCQLACDLGGSKGCH